MGWWSKFESAHGLMGAVSMDGSLIISFGSKFQDLNDSWILMHVGIWTNLFGSLFRVRVHGTTRCCGREIFRRLYVILYRKTSCCCSRRVSNVCQPSLLCMCVTLVERRWSCTTNRAALCIFSRVSILFWVCGFQAIAPYSNFGLTSMLQAASYTFGLADIGSV